MAIITERSLHKVSLLALPNGSHCQVALEKAPTERSSSLPKLGYCIKFYLFYSLQNIPLKQLINKAEDKAQDSRQLHSLLFTLLTIEAKLI